MATYNQLWEIQLKQRELKSVLLKAEEINNELKQLKTKYGVK